jgi:hypothetical protein
MYSVDRMVALVRPQKAFLDWLNQLPGNEYELTLDQIRSDCTVLLVPEFDEPEEAIAYIDDIYTQVFEMELASWCEDHKLWPRERSLRLFWEWLDVEIHSTLIDTVEAPLSNHPLAGSQSSPLN